MKNITRSTWHRTWNSGKRAATEAQQQKEEIQLRLEIGGTEVLNCNHRTGQDNKAEAMVRGKHF